MANDGSLVQSGRTFGPEELELVCSTVSLFPGLSHKEMVLTVCELLEWTTITGSAKETACANLLDALAAEGRIPPLSKRACARGANRKSRRRGGSAIEPEAPVSGDLAQVAPVGLDLVTERELVDLWNESVDRHHELGYRKPFGYPMRYFVRSQERYLGCVLLAGAAKAIEARDHWIGWSAQQRLDHLPFVVNNTRFLLFPWVRVRHLASHVLGQLARRVRVDYRRRWGFEPVLLETFVDARHYRGTCYRAAGWLELGETSGRGLPRPGRTYTTSPKRIFVRPLAEDFRRQLCEGPRGKEVRR